MFFRHVPSSSQINFLRVYGLEINKKELDNRSVTLPWKGRIAIFMRCFPRGFNDFHSLPPTRLRKLFRENGILLLSEIATWRLLSGLLEPSFRSKPLVATRSRFSVDMNRSDIWELDGPVKG